MCVSQRGVMLDICGTVLVAFASCRAAASPSGSLLNGAAVTQPTKTQPETRVTVGSPLSSSTTPSGTTHTKWCDQETGDASSPATPHTVTAKETLPRRCQRVAEYTP